MYSNWGIDVWRIDGPRKLAFLRLRQNSWIFWTKRIENVGFLKIADYENVKTYRWTLEILYFIDHCEGGNHDALSRCRKKRSSTNALVRRVEAATNTKRVTRTTTYRITKQIAGGRMSIPCIVRDVNGRLLIHGNIDNLIEWICVQKEMKSSWHHPTQAEQSVKVYLGSSCKFCWAPTANYS